MNQNKKIKLSDREVLNKMPLFPPIKVSTKKLMDRKELKSLFNFMKKNLEKEGGKTMMENGKSRISFPHILGGFYIMIEEEIIQAQGLYDNTKYRFNKIEDIDKLIEALKRLKKLMKTNISNNA